VAEEVGAPPGVGVGLLVVVDRSEVVELAQEAAAEPMTVVRAAAEGQPEAEAQVPEVVAANYSAEVLAAEERALAEAVVVQQSTRIGTVPDSDNSKIVSRSKCRGE